MPIRRALAVLAIALCLATPARAAERLVVMLEWFVNPDHAPLVVADRLGLFERAGLAVEMIPPADPSSVPRLVAAGQADIGVHYQPNLFLDHAAGVRLVRVGTLVETPLNSLVVLADGPVREIADLKGRTVGFSVSGFEDALLGAMLANAGLTLWDVTLVNVNFALTPALLAGRVDATIGSFRNFELTQMRLEGREGRAFFPEEHGVPAYDELIFVTRPDLLADPRLPRFLDAVEAAALHIANHPEDSWALFAAAHPGLDDALNRQAWIDTLPRLAKRPGALDRTRYRRFGAFLAERGLIPAMPDLGEVAVEIERAPPH